MRRRTLLSATAAATAAMAAAPDSTAPAMPPLDYGRSFLSGKAEWNRVRFWVESRTRIVDQRSGVTEDFLQCASCKSEDTFAKANLFYKDNYDFLPIFGPTHGVIFRRKVNAAVSGYRQVRPAAQMWDGQTMRLQPARNPQLLNGTAAIRRATHAAHPLVAQTEIENPETGLRAIIEFPVKTINVHDAKDLYQVDTGPVALPDLSRRWDTLAASISLAFVAFNAPGFADFVIEAETALPEGGRTHHFSRLASFKSVNRLFACR